MVERDKRPPSVTVTMSCYNHLKYVEQAIRSVLMQKTNFPVNIVIHDDASPDGSADIIRRYAAENPNITAILQPVNLYQNGKSSLPYRIPYYTGKYIANLECDDYWLDEHKLQRQVDYLESNPDCIAVYHNILPVNKFGEHDESCRKENEQDKGFQDTDEGDFEAGNLKQNMKHQMGSLVMRNIWRFMTPEDIDFYISMRTNAGDAKIFKLLVGHGRIHYFKEKLSAYRRVVDEGDSFSARMARMSEYDKYKRRFLSALHMNRMLEYFFGKKYRMKYFHVLLWELRGLVKFRRSVMKEVDLSPCNDYKNIPLYVYSIFPFYLTYKLVRKIIWTLRQE